jgi:hypothetical protein
MSIFYIKNLIKDGNIRDQVDCPSSIDKIYTKLEYDSTKVDSTKIKDAIFKLRNFCGPYSNTNLNDVIVMLNFYIHVYSEGMFKNEKKVSHYKNILKIVEVIFLDIGFPHGKNIWNNAWYYRFDRCIEYISKCYENQGYRLHECYTKQCSLGILPGFGKSTIAKIIYTIHTHKILPDVKEIINKTIGNCNKNRDKQKEILIKQLEKTEMILKTKNLQLKTDIVNSLLE